MYDKFVNWCIDKNVVTRAWKSRNLALYFPYEQKVPYSPVQCLQRLCEIELPWMMRINGYCSNLVFWPPLYPTSLGWFCLRAPSAWSYPTVKPKICWLIVLLFSTMPLGTNWFRDWSRFWRESFWGQWFRFIWPQEGSSYPSLFFFLSTDSRAYSWSISFGCFSVQLSLFLRVSLGLIFSMYYCKLSPLSLGKDWGSLLQFAFPPGAKFLTHCPDAGNENHGILFSEWHPTSGALGRWVGPQRQVSVCLSQAVTLIPLVRARAFRTPLFSAVLLSK